MGVYIYNIEVYIIYIYTLSKSQDSPSKSLISALFPLSCMLGISLCAPALLLVQFEPFEAEVLPIYPWGEAPSDPAT